jgi:hypothetical protein
MELDDGKEFIKGIEESRKKDRVLPSPCKGYPALAQSIEHDKSNTWMLALAEGEELLYATFDADVDGYQQVLDEWIELDNSHLKKVISIRKTLKISKAPLKAVVNSLRHPVSSAKKKQQYPEYNILRTVVSESHGLYQAILLSEKEMIAEEKHIKRERAALKKLREAWYLD